MSILQAVTNEMDDTSCLHLGQILTPLAERVMMAWGTPSSRVIASYHNSVLVYVLQRST